MQKNGWCYESKLKLIASIYLKETIKAKPKFIAESIDRSLTISSFMWGDEPKKMARDKYPRPCLPLKPQEKKLLFIKQIIYCYKQSTTINHGKIGRNSGCFQ